MAGGLFKEFLMKPLMPKTIAFTAAITEDELRKRLVEEVLDNMGALNPDGTIPDGITWAVTRGDSRKGGYTVEIRGPAPARLMLAKEGGQ